MKDVVKHAVHFVEENNTISSRLDWITESQKFAQIFVCSLIKTSTFTASINKLVKMHSEIAVVNEASFYDRAAIVGKENGEVKSPSPTTERCQALLSIIQIGPEEEIKEEERPAQCIAVIQEVHTHQFSSKVYNVYGHSKDVNVIGPVITRFSEALNYNSYRLDKQL